MEEVLRTYPSLYDSNSGTVIAILIGLAIIGALLRVVGLIFQVSANEHEALTRFVMSMVAVVVGVYVADLLIAGPDTSLLADTERSTILAFIKDTCLTVFAYYFGTRSLPPTSVQLPPQDVLPDPQKSDWSAPPSTDPPTLPASMPPAKKGTG